MRTAIEILAERTDEERAADEALVVARTVLKQATLGVQQAEHEALALRELAEPQRKARRPSVEAGS